MTINPVYQSGNSIGDDGEQSLIEDLIIESIQIRGFDVLYLPRTFVNLDRLFGEDTLSQYQSAHMIEVYMETDEGWDGNSEFFSKFGIVVRDKATLVMSKRRWEETVKANAPVLQLPNRPAEGDLIYFRPTDSMFEVTYVEHLSPFLQIGSLPIYKLEVQLFTFSSEEFDTGEDDLDEAFRQMSTNVYAHTFQMESGETFLGVNGQPIALESHALEDVVPNAKNQGIRDEAFQFIDFTNINPYGEL